MSKLDEAAEKLYEAAWGAGLDQYDRKAITRAAIDAIVAACVEKLAEARNHEYGRQHDKGITALYERIEALTAELEKVNLWLFGSETRASGLARANDDLRAKLARFEELTAEVERWKNAWTRSESELARLKEKAKDTGACMCSPARRAEADHPPDCKVNRRDAVPHTKEQWRRWNLTLGCWAVLGSLYATKEGAQRECDGWNKIDIFQHKYEPRIYRQAKTSEAGVAWDAVPTTLRSALQPYAVATMK